MNETWPPRVLRWRTRGRIDGEALQRIVAEGRGLVADHPWWCGAPIFTAEKKNPGKARGRVSGEATLCFGWDGAPGAERLAADDQFMAARDARYLLERLRAWSETLDICWEVEMPTGDVASIANGRLDPRFDARPGEEDTTAKSRAAELVERHVDRHRGVDAPVWSSVGLVARKEHIASLARRIPLGAMENVESTVAALGSEIRVRRSCGELWFGAWRLRPLPEEAPTTIADRVASEVGLTPLGADWLPLTRAEAEAILVCVLRKDMAYDAPLMTGEQAGFLASRFLMAFPDDSQLFSNATMRDGRIGDATYLVSGATFEGGVVVVSDARCGILWVGDED